MLSCRSFAFVAVLCSLSGTACAGSSSGTTGFVESLLSSFNWQADAAAGSGAETAASDTADAPICFEAFVTEYPRCEEYVSQGYTCVGGWCAVDRCVGHCHECARKYEGSVVDVQTGRCTSDLWLTARKARRIFFEMMPAIEAGRRAAGAAVGGDGVGVGSAGQMVLASLQTLLSLAALFFVYKVVALLLSVLRAAVSFTTGLVLGFGAFVLLDLYFPAAMQVLRSSAETGIAWFAACFAV